MTDTQVGSCEPCKRKKCKCDRQLPYCGQCVGMPSKCKFAENSKRGIPSGYLSRLEQRLSDTEVALYDALLEIRKLKATHDRDDLPPQQSTLDVSRDSRHTKTSMMAEWDRYPLKNPEDVDRWWDDLGSDISLQAGPTKDHSSVPSDATGPQYVDQEQQFQHPQLDPVNEYEESLGSASSNTNPKLSTKRTMFGTITEQTLPPTDTWLQVSNPPSGWTATEGEGYEQARFSTHDTLGRSPGVRTETVGSQGSPAGMSQASQSDLQPIPARASGQNTVLVKSQSLSKRMRHMYY